MEDFRQGFRGPERPLDLFDFLDDVDTIPTIREIKGRMLALCPVGVGEKVLDVGCGLGHEAVRLADRVGPGGVVAGVDIAEEFVAEARRRAGDENRNLNFTVGSVMALPFPDDLFDVCRAERVLIHLDDPSEALREMVRVVRPGGRVTAFDFDMGAYVIDSDDQAMTRRVEKILVEHWPIANLGRQLPFLFRHAGLVELAFEPRIHLPPFHIFSRITYSTLKAATTQGKLTEQELGAWWSAIETAARSGQFLHSELGFIVAGRKL